MQSYKRIIGFGESGQTIWRFKTVIIISEFYCKYYSLNENFVFFRHKMISRSRGTAIECLMPSPTRKTRHFKSRDRGHNWRVAETGDLKELRANRLKGKESESRSDSRYSILFCDNFALIFKFRPKSKKSVNSSDGLEANDFDNFNRFDFCDEDSMSLSDEENEETDDFRSVGQPLDPSIRSTRIPLKLCFSVLTIFVLFFVYKHYNDLEVFLNVYKSKT
jgi:hypothetical protein